MRGVEDEAPSGTGCARRALILVILGICSPPAAAWCIGSMYHHEVSLADLRATYSCRAETLTIAGRISPPNNTVRHVDAVMELYREARAA